VLTRLADGRGGEGVDAADGDGGDAAGAGGMVRKKWIARETAAVERDARRTERFAVLIPERRGCRR
jgi:primosomal protein N' (replication factor Y)